MPETTEPTHDLNERPSVILELPVLSDEAALQLSELLQSLLEHFDTGYDAQILRAHRARQIECERLYRQQRQSEAQQSLPFEDILF